MRFVYLCSVEDLFDTFGNFRTNSISRDHCNSINPLRSTQTSEFMDTSLFFLPIKAPLIGLSAYDRLGIVWEMRHGLYNPG
jgi:hypothetical protein